MDADERQAVLEQARGGDAQAVGTLLEGYRPYVRVLVRAFKDERLQGKVGESDLIQDALLEAHRCFASFQGSTPAELAAWLRQIVIRSVGHTIRGFLGTEKRDVAREQAMAGFAQLLARSGSTPSAVAIRHEQAARMAAALAQLPDDMQQVLLGRHVDNLSHAEIAAKLGRTEAATRVLYTRALRKLREVLQ